MFCFLNTVFTNIIPDLHINDSITNDNMQHASQQHDVHAHNSRKQDIRTTTTTPQTPFSLVCVNTGIGNSLVAIKKHKLPIRCVAYIEPDIEAVNVARTVPDYILPVHHDVRTFMHDVRHKRLKLNTDILEITLDEMVYDHKSRCKMYVQLVTVLQPKIILIACNTPPTPTDDSDIDVQRLHNDLTRDLSHLSYHVSSSNLRSSLHGDYTSKVRWYMVACLTSLPIPKLPNVASCVRTSWHHLLDHTPTVPITCHERDKRVLHIHAPSNVPNGCSLKVANLDAQDGGSKEGIFEKGKFVMSTSHPHCSITTSHAHHILHEHVIRPISILEACAIHSIPHDIAQLLNALPRARALAHIARSPPLSLHAHIFNHTIIPITKRMTTNMLQLRQTNYARNTNWLKTKLFVPGSVHYTWDIVHRMLDHPSTHVMRTMQKHDMIHGIQSLPPIPPHMRSKCDACMLSEAECRPINDKSSMPITVENTLSIGVDIGGKYPIESLNGNWYDLTFKEKNKSFCAVYFMKTKDQVIHKFKDFLNDFKLQFNDIACINIAFARCTSDPDSMFISRAFKDMLREMHTSQWLSPPYVHVLNFVEPEMKVLNRKSLARLNDAGAPPSWWEHARADAAFIRQRQYTTSFNDPDDQFKTPIERITGIKPCMSDFIRFGCKCFVYIDAC